MRTAAVLVLAAIFAIGACTSDAQAPVADHNQPKAGLWEVTVDQVSMDPPPTPELRAALAEEMPTARVDRQCFPGTRPQVGQPIQNGQCRYTRVADEGGRAQREASCTGNRTITWTGTRAADHYEYRIEVRQVDSETGRTLRSVVTRERGRRLGVCAPDSR